jgi:hypothetical protein
MFVPKMSEIIFPPSILNNNIQINYDHHNSQLSQHNKP